MECKHAGNSYIDRKGKARKPICKKFGGKCFKGSCNYIKRQKEIIKNQIK